MNVLHIERLKMCDSMKALHDSTCGTCGATAYGPARYCIYTGYAYCRQACFDYHVCEEHPLDMERGGVGDGAL